MLFAICFLGIILYINSVGNQYTETTQYIKLVNDTANPVTHFKLDVGENTVFDNEVNIPGFYNGFAEFNRVKATGDLHYWVTLEGGKTLEGSDGTLGPEDFTHNLLIIYESGTLELRKIQK